MGKAARQTRWYLGTEAHDVEKCLTYAEMPKFRILLGEVCGIFWFCSTLGDSITRRILRIIKKNPTNVSGDFRKTDKVIIINRLV